MQQNIANLYLQTTIAVYLKLHGIRSVTFY